MDLDTLNEEQEFDYTIIRNNEVIAKGRTTFQAIAPRIGLRGIAINPKVRSEFKDAQIGDQLCVEDETVKVLYDISQDTYDPTWIYIMCIDRREK